jgi:hypothetical protein
MHLFAGMPSVSLTDVAKLRLENISFFLVGFFVCAFLIKLLWNYLARDWTFLPRLSYGKAVGLVALWGLLFVLVLTMISGARELMTPGAWEKKGFTHQLVDEAKAKRLQERKGQLEKLRAALWKYADEHGGKFPVVRSDPAIAAALWNVPHPTGTQYLYAPGERGNSTTPLAFEPELFGVDRLVLCVDGEIRTMTSDEIARALPAEKK